ncbi:copper resistance protein CopC [Micromonospora sp. R77]|uniref:copper resistance CopC family protein n=1 Tax=Micromonospora sp. R77 TaxID=2925836 RepID=UPI001F614E8C|nr:copper resistance CopC family protein [Micromonospora sp. R77]MCI4061219.1 copper resistance protein CopC [Micromonospora sp. R77]
MSDRMPVPAAGDRRRGRLLGAAVVLVVVTVGLLVALSESSPATLRAVTPADGATLAAPPPTVALVFDREVAPREVHLTVTTAGGDRVTVGPPTVAGTTVTAPVSISAAGGYLIGYHVVLPGGREVSGVDRFRVTAAGPGVPATAVPDPAAEAAGAATGHQHGGDDPLSLGLSLVAVAALLALLTVLVRPARLRD